MSMNKALIALAIGWFVAGCAAIQNEDPAAKTAIQVATLKVIGEDAERAQRVHDIAGEVRTLVSGDSTSTMDALEQRVRDEIRWDRLDQAEQLVATNLVDAVRAEIETRIDGGTLDPDARVAVETVMEWIQEAAAMAGGGTSVAATETAAGPSHARLDREARHPAGDHLRT